MMPYDGNNAIIELMTFISNGQERLERKIDSIMDEMVSLKRKLTQTTDLVQAYSSSHLNDAMVVEPKIERYILVRCANGQYYQTSIRSRDYRFYDTLPDHKIVYSIDYDTAHRDLRGEVALELVSKGLVEMVAGQKMTLVGMYNEALLLNDVRRVATRRYSFP